MTKKTKNKKAKKAQIIGEVLKYLLVGAFAIFTAFIGYKAIHTLQEKGCDAEIVKFEIDLKGMDKSLRFGAKELKSYFVPCGIDKIFFLDLNKEINPGDFDGIPIIKDIIENGGSDNTFLIKNGDVKRSFSAGNMDIGEPYYACLIPVLGGISFFIEGAGKSAKMTLPDEQPECR